MSNTIRIVQLTDLHLFENVTHCLTGLNTEDSFNAVAEMALEEQANHQIDLVLVTGDIAQKATLSTYERAGRKLSAFKAPIYSLKGNHDLTQFFDQTDLSKINAQHFMCTEPTRLNLNKWVILMFNSNVEGAVLGEATQTTLTWLDQQLMQVAPDQYVLIALHHNPIAVGSHWLDAHMLRDAEAFFKVIVKYPQVKLVLHGHVHQEFEAYFQHIRVLSTPSTGLQFAPLQFDYKVDRIAPGYRWLDLHEDGHIDTGVSRLSYIPEGVDWGSAGY